MKMSFKKSKNVLEQKSQNGHATIFNIADRLPENSRNSFVDLQSQKNSKKDRPKKSSSLKADILYFEKLNLYKFLLSPLAALK